jgi:hypothetical protein
MKHYLFLSVICFIFSCNNGPTNEELAQAKKKQEDLKMMAGFLEGEWINANFLTLVEGEKRVYGVREEIERRMGKEEYMLLGFYLDKKELSGDTAYFYGFTEHEGGYQSPIRFDAKRIIFVNDTAREDENNLGSPFELTLGNDGRVNVNYVKKKRSDYYEHVTSLDDKLRHILFTGKYYQPGKEESAFEFTSEGELKGFGNRKYYEVLDDFTGMAQFDMVVFADSSDKNPWSNGDGYKFEIRGDTIRLYAVNYNEENVRGAAGALKYALIRK